MIWEDNEGCQYRVLETVNLHCSIYCKKLMGSWMPCDEHTGFQQRCWKVKELAEKFLSEYAMIHAWKRVR